MKGAAPRRWGNVMFKIRKEQMDLFEEAAILNLEERTVDYLRASLPFHSEVHGDIGLREVVRLGRQRAAGYGITAEGDVQRYVLLMFGMGSHFDRDPLLPWAAATLRDPTIPEGSGRIERLYDEALARRARVAIKRRPGIVSRRLRPLLELRPRPGKVDRPIQPPTPSPTSITLDPVDLQFAFSVLEQLHQVFPEKFDEIGEDLIRPWIRAGVQEALRHDLTTERGAKLYVGLMFILGSGVAIDPQFPWVASILGDRPEAERALRVNRLYEATARYLRRWLSSINRIRS
jgi:hypothetical protein